MKRKSYGKMLLSVCLVCAMIFTSTDWSQAAEWLREISAGQEVKKSQEKQVVLSESTKNSTTFQLADGKKLTERSRPFFMVRTSGLKMRMENLQTMIQA